MTSIKRGDKLRARYTRRYDNYRSMADDTIRIPKGTYLTVGATATAEGDGWVIAYSGRGDVTLSPLDLAEFDLFAWDGVQGIGKAGFTKVPHKQR